MRIAVVGAGMVGVSCALALQRRGVAVTLIDRLPPGHETSHGNAGILSPSSLIPFNNPTLWKQLPGLLSGKNPGFHYNLQYLTQEFKWAWKFLAHARQTPFQHTLNALNGLISQSRRIHQTWMEQAGIRHRLRDQGWLFLYRTEAAWQASQWARNLYTQHGIAFTSLDPGELRELEPGLNPVFAKGVWFPGADSVDDPGEVVRAYAQLFLQHGGHFLHAEVQRLHRTNTGAWDIHGLDKVLFRADHVVLALGPFSKAFLAQQGLMNLPMAFERGSHMHYAPGPNALNRPIYDTGGGYVLSPMNKGWRLTTGVELNALQAPVQDTQLDQAEARAREALILGNRLDREIWRGSRPTLPDSRPMIGACPGETGVWLALGHQHIGFSTGPASGELLANLILGEKPMMDASPFDPHRFRT